MWGSSCFFSSVLELQVWSMKPGFKSWFTVNIFQTAKPPSATMVSGVCSQLCYTEKLHSWKYLHYFHFTFIINHFINQCMCVHVCIWHMCRGTHVEARGKLCAADSSPPTVLWVWGLNSGCQAFLASTFAHWATSSAHKNGWFLFVSMCVSLCACRGQREV